MARADLIQISAIKKLGSVKTSKYIHRLLESSSFLLKSAIFCILTVLTQLFYNCIVNNIIVSPRARLRCSSS